MNLLYSGYKPHALKQAVLVRSGRPQFMSYFTLQTAYSTAVPTREKNYSFFFLFCSVITMFNVSFIFTVVLVTAARSRSACHILLLRDKGSSAQQLGSEHHRG